jgi:hypothetical protein
MKMIATTLVCLFACAAMAEGTAAATQTGAPTAPAAATQAKTPAPTAMQAKKDDMCAGKHGKALKKCKTEMKKAAHE